MSPRHCRVRRGEPFDQRLHSLWLNGLAELGGSGMDGGWGVGIIHFLATNARAHPNSVCDSLFIHRAK